MVCDENKGACFLRLGVVDLEKKRFSIFIPKGRGVKGGWASMAETFRCLGVWSPETGCLMEGEKKSEAWVRIVGLPVSLWDQAILRRVGEECGGFLAIDSQTEKLEELQWARILVKLNGEEILNVVEIWVEGVCYSLTL